MKANHNLHNVKKIGWIDVSDTSKILKWKQITTIHIHIIPIIRCFRYFKDTKMKANHNETRFRKTINEDVSDTSKILKWKQITTYLRYYIFWIGCFRYFKDTKMKANHNEAEWQTHNSQDVSDTSKILKWKQITTLIGWNFFFSKMFPILQRY